MRRNFLFALIAMAVLGSAALAQVPPLAVAPPKPTQPAPTDGGPVFADGTGDAQDVLFLSSTRPVLMRLHVKIDGVPFRTVWDDFMAKLFNYLDRDRDGVLSKAEAERAMPVYAITNLLASGFPYYDMQIKTAKMDELDTAPKDGKVTREELAAYYKKGGVQQMRVQINGGAYSETLTTALYKNLDANKDGKLSRAELLAAPEVLRRLDLNEDEIIGQDELQGSPNYGGYATAVAFDYAGSAPVMQAPGINMLTILGAGVSIRPVVQEIFKRYDANKDKKLTATELGMEADCLDALDANRDGSLDAAEMEKWFDRPADLELRVHLDSGRYKGVVNQAIREFIQTVGKPAVLEMVQGSVRKPGGHKLLRKVGADRMLLTTSDAVMEIQRGQSGTFSSDAGVKQFLRQQFVQADKDKNGLIDRRETRNPEGYGQYFVAMIVLADRDGDGKLSLEEVFQFVDLVTAGASAHTVLSFTDQGRGLFELLDENGDSRLSAREWRTGWGRVEAWDRNKDGILDEKEVPRKIALMVDVGQSGLPSNGVPLAQAFGFANLAPPGTQQKSAPLWFTRMDANGDGDVSLKEFLGSEEEFGRIDADGDGLISADEAIRADAAMRKAKK